MPLKSSVAALVTKKSIFALILVSTVALGAGFGALDSPFGGDSSQPTDQTDLTNATSTPDPTVTPPPTETGDDEGSDQQPTTTAAPSNSTEESAEAANSDESDESDENDENDRSERSNDRSDRSNGNDERDADLGLSVGDAADVRSDDGSVDVVRGHLSGTVSWERANVDAVVFVVSARTDDGTWREATRETVATEDERELDLRTVFGDDAVTYADDDTTAAFANDDDGTTVERTGRVGVTVVLFDGEREVARVTETGAYAFDVTNVEASVGVSAESDATASALGSDGLAAGFA
ncbi:hypothetical protein [Haloprofundus halophilus]|uniref:hypothetical protein n=1 Tax=Haloprofundus halophilus TaxID=2283527 RepID=UPI000E44FE30|nr:hypothetical protein [Haloprofundus halophilus]